MAITITKPTIGGSEDSWGLTINNALDDVVAALNGTAGTVAPDHTVLTINGTNVTSTAAELNILDGVTATAAELNVLDGVTATTAEINYLDGVTSSIQTQINSIIAGESGGTVTSVGLTAPTGFAVSGSPITTSGTLGLSFASGYSLLTSAQATSISNIPTATSQLTNNSGFITSSSVPTATSQLTNDSGFITSLPTSLGAVGTYALLVRSTGGSTITEGTTYAGSGLRYTGLRVGEGAFYEAFCAGNFGGTPSGTWRAMGTSNNNSGINPANIFLRIS